MGAQLCCDVLGAFVTAYVRSRSRERVCEELADLSRRRRGHSIKLVHTECATCPVCNPCFTFSRQKVGFGGVGNFVVFLPALPPLRPLN